MEWTVEAIKHELEQKPELVKLVEVINSFLPEKRSEAIRKAVEFLNNCK